MIRFTVFLVAALAVGQAAAQYEGPATEACRALGEREVSREAVRIEGVVIDRDRHLLIERTARKVGSQPVSAVLTGNGAIVYPGLPAIELSFICLLADEKRALSFNWLPRYAGVARSQCSRSASLKAGTLACLESLLIIGEADLTRVSAVRFQEARERDGAGSEAVSDQYRAASLAWRTYRDAECERHARAAPAARDVARAACMVDLTRQRVRDVGGMP